MGPKKRVYQEVRWEEGLGIFDAGTILDVQLIFPK
jgi:hypothetical protein